jgi:SAM-dependent methyltransferase
MRKSWRGFVLAVCCAALLPPSAFFAFAQAPAATQASDTQIYEKFRAWITGLPPDQQAGDPEPAYRKVLAAEGLSASEIDRQIRIIDEQGQRLEIERWNRILTSPTAAFNRKPNAFLAEMAQGIKPGRALDVGMGQGRNAIYLAQQGWAVTGFDPADKAVALAEEEAKRLGVKLTTRVVRDDQFDFGKDQWDLVVLSYVGARDLVARVFESLKPGGFVVVEGFHRDSTKTARIGEAVVFDTNELLKIFERFRVVRYEDTDGIADFGMDKMRLVRLCAQKP